MEKYFPKEIRYEVLRADAPEAGLIDVVTVSVESKEPGEGFEGALRLWILNWYAAPRVIARYVWE